MALAMFVFTLTAFAQTETSAEPQTETEEVDWKAFLTGLYNKISEAFEEAVNETTLPVTELNEKEQ